MKKIIALASVALFFAACGGTPPSSSTLTSNTPTTPTLVTNMQGGQTDLTGIWSLGCKLGAPDELETHTYTGAQFIAVQVGYATSDGTCGGTPFELGRLTADYTISTSVVAAGGWNAAAPPIPQDGIANLPSFPTLAHLTVSNQVGAGTLANPNPSPDIYWAIDASVPTAPIYYYVTSPGGSLTAGVGSFLIKQ